MLSSIALASILPALVLAVPLNLKTRQTASGGFQIQFAGNQNQCLTVLSSPSAYANGVQVSNYPCDNTFASGQQIWNISPGNNLVQLTGTNFCLDAGSNPSNNGAMKIWQCYPGLFQQQWYYTADHRIAITGGTQCLDLANGVGPAQTYQCTTGNSNQVWNAIGPNSPPPVSSSVVPSASSTVSPPPSSTSSTVPASSSAVTPPPVSGSTAIFPNGDTKFCLTAENGGGAYASGQVVDLALCNGGANQQWLINYGNNIKGVQLAGTNFCLDAGSVPSNNVQMKIWQCYPGLSQQTWYLTNDNRIAITGGTQCLDSPVDSTYVQTFQCTTGNTNQIWTYSSSST